MDVRPPPYNVVQRHSFGASPAPSITRAKAPAENRANARPYCTDARLPGTATCTACDSLCASA